MDEMEDYYYQQSEQYRNDIEQAEKDGEDAYYDGVCFKQNPHFNNAGGSIDAGVAWCRGWKNARESNKVITRDGNNKS